MDNRKIKIKEFFIANEYKIILFFSFALVAVLAFEAGILKGAKISQKAVIIENSALSSSSSADKDVSGARNLPQEALKDGDSPSVASQNCAYAGSKNSNKYHLPSCQYAKRIKPENVVCFKDENEAKLRGYQPDLGCIK